MTKTPECERALKRDLEERDGIEKILHGDHVGRSVAPMSERIRVDRSLELDKESRSKVKMRIGRTEEALSATTMFRGEATSRATPTRACAATLTGRQHQIRLHLARLGTPIVGDKLYGPDEALSFAPRTASLPEDDLASSNCRATRCMQSSCAAASDHARAARDHRRRCRATWTTFWAKLTCRAALCRDRPDRAPRE